jgi:preprotein translocase SecE subunit
MIKQQQPVTQKGKAKPGDERKPLMDMIKEYILSLKFEWLKLSFPSRKELTQSTVVVFLFTVFLMLIISLYDVFMTFLMNRLIPTT